MKTYEELTSEILAKAKTEKRARRKRLIAASSTVAGLCLVLSASLIGAHFAGAFSRGTIDLPEGDKSIVAAEDYSQVYAMLEINRETVLDKVIDGFGSLLGGMKNEDVEFDMMTNGAPSFRDEGALEAAPENATPTDDNLKGDSDSSTTEHSDTNVQVEGIMEADVVKTDGKFIYVLSFNKLYIVSAKDGMTEKISESEFYSKDTDSQKKTDSYHSVIHNAEMYVRGDRLMIVYTVNEDSGYYTVADIYDVSDRSTPEKLVSLGMSGSYHASRMNGAKLYLTSTEVFYDESIRKGKPETYIPSEYRNGEETVLAVDDVYCGTEKSSCRYLNVCEIDTNALEITSRVSLLGFGGGEIYQSAGNLYATRSMYGVEEDGVQLSKTLIAKVSLNGELKLHADTTVDGTVLNSFSMDEYDGYFRLVTTVNITVVDYGKASDVISDDVVSARWGSYNNLYVLDGDLKEVGKLENLAKDERIYSARFDGTIAYFVTYRETDPLFCADLSDPTNPVILSALKIPGFSEYLHKFGSDLLFGLGKTDDRYVKLSMFDISDKADVTEKDVSVLYGEYYSEASQDHHAILVDYGKNLIAFPGKYYYVFSFENGFFVKKAQLEYSVGQYGYSWSARGLYIGDYLYVVTPFGIDSYSLDDFAKASSVTLGNAAENPYGYTFYCD